MSAWIERQKNKYTFAFIVYYTSKCGLIDLFSRVIPDWRFERKEFDSDVIVGGLIERELGSVPFCHLSAGAQSWCDAGHNEPRPVSHLTPQLGNQLNKIWNSRWGVNE